MDLSALLPPPFPSSFSSVSSLSFPLSPSLHSFSASRDLFTGALYSLRSSLPLSAISLRLDSLTCSDSFYLSFQSDPTVFHAHPLSSSQPRAKRRARAREKECHVGAGQENVRPVWLKSAERLDSAEVSEWTRESIAPLIGVSLSEAPDSSTLMECSASCPQPVPYSGRRDHATMLDEFARLSEDEYRKRVREARSERSRSQQEKKHRETEWDVRAFGSARANTDDIDADAKDEAPNSIVSQSALASKWNHCARAVDSDRHAENREAHQDSINRELDDLLADDVDSWVHTLGSNSASSNVKTRSWANLDRLDVSAFADLVPQPALRWPFELDVFQKEAIVHLELGNSMFVAAHTSAGKTVIAEYAIALAQKQMTRAIYTSPIKTLSNQKFREFRTKFGVSEVGLITGDVSIQPEAPCLIMTTEILRSMLYKGADLLRDLHFVIFDEIHYINDADRGVVWEEALVLLPEHTQIVLLSATVPNVAEFASWVGRIKQKVIQVIFTDKRPVPLQHALYVKNKFYTFLDAQGHFQGSALKQAKDESLSDKKKALGIKGVNTRPRSSHPPWHALIRTMQSSALLPAVIFCFSKRMCEVSATSLYRLDLTTHSDKSAILIFFNTSLSRLSPADRRLPQCLHVRDLARRGIGVHHAGMLPILKETVEILYQRGLLRVLFATETFAMGVNMPCRTVAFHSLRKHDGNEFRALFPGEYTQMSGRAGRRGLDPYGLVLVIAPDPESLPEESMLRHLCTGKPTKLESKFRLTFNMILNLLRQEELRVEDMMRSSFAEADEQRQSVDRKKMLNEGERALNRVRQQVDNEAHLCQHCSPVQLAEFAELFEEADAQHTRLIRFAMSETAPLELTKRVWQSGRVFIISKFDSPPAVAVLLRPSTSGYATLMLAPIAHSINTFRKSITSSSGDVIEAGEMTLLSSGATRGWLLLRTLRPRDIQAVCDYVLNVDQTAVDVLDRHQPHRVDTLMQELETIEQRHHIQSCASGLLIDGTQHAESIPLLKLMAGVRINLLDVDAVELATTLDRLADIRARLSSLRHVAVCHRLTQHLACISKAQAIQEQVERLRMTLDDSNLQLMADYQSKLRVLRALNFIDTSDAVLIKGRVACELNTCDSLIGTQLIFESALADLTPEEILATLSCLLFQERDADQPDLDERLSLGVDRLHNILTSLAAVQVHCGCELEMEPGEWVEASMNTGLVEVVHAWSCNMSFLEICALTNVLEGSIVRLMNRLHETCKEFGNAARVLGDQSLYHKMDIAATLIRRDIVFAASLYLT